MDPFWRASLLFFTTLVYLFIGAGIFSVLEGHYEEVAKVNINKTVEDFLAKHKDVTFGELMDVLHEIRKSDDMGVSSDDVIAGTYHNRWDVVNAFYFCVTTITTIGFGHLAPATSAGRIFTIFYATIGIPTMIWFLIESGMLLKNKFKVLSQRFQNCLSRRISTRLCRLSITGFISFLSVYILLILIPAIIFSLIEGWSHIDSQYFAFIAIFTIGFGDYIPTEQLGGWQEWIYKLATTFYYYIGLVTLVTIGCILQDFRSDFNTVAHQRMIVMDSMRGQNHAEDQMGELEEKELALGHLSLQMTDTDTNFNAEDAMEDRFSDNDDENGGGKDGKYRKL